MFKEEFVEEFSNSFYWSLQVKQSLPCVWSLCDSHYTIIHFLLVGVVHTMATEDHQTSNGWPLGLQVMNTRLRVVESLQAAPAVEPYSLHTRSSSFSSFSSSNLDTESTASFFQDHSVSLGRLIGLRPGDRGGLYLPNTIRIEEHDGISATGACTDVSRGRRVDMSQGICIPLLVAALVKMRRSRSKSNGNVCW